ncbi:MAG: type III-B CRISPR module RAMP protein Cmr4 [Ktedonobacteraceae bacterium]|nr:type III-B CRISPR module RAMP protein Cmr4 [Ktedonobacteraceae bacterium]
MDAQLTFIHVLSRLHAGVGQGTGVIDLPIAREKSTGLPYLPGSSLKGALRTRCFHDEKSDTCRPIFGPDNPNEEDNQASLAQFTDQRLLFLPMRSLAGTFAWVTCPFVLRRLLRDIENAGITPPTRTIPRPSDAEHCIIVQTKTQSSVIALDVEAPDKDAAASRSQKSTQSMVYLEDLDLQVQADTDSVIFNWATWIARQVFPQDAHSPGNGKAGADNSWQDMFIARFCLVHDDVFTFMLNTATEITARIRLNEDSKTVKEGHLWYEESLPTETILSGLVLASRTKNADLSSQQIFETLTQLTGQTIQLGGKATVGCGLCRVRLSADNGEEHRL